MQQLNDNRYGMTFTGKWHTETIDYLDLEIFKNRGELCTKTFFKKTERNGYIPISSCHHPKWIGNIPKGQLLRIRRNCHLLEDFDIQADTLIKRFRKRTTRRTNYSKLKMTYEELIGHPCLIKKNDRRKMTTKI